MPGPAVAKVTDPQIQALMELERRGQLPDDLKGQLDMARRQGVAPQLKGDPNGGAIDKATDIFDAIQQAHANTGVTTTGFGGSVLGNVPGTAGRDLRGYVNTLKANLAFDQLAQMRAQSPTGGALGSVSDAEEKLLSGSVADLDPSQSQEVFKGNLDKVGRHYGQWLKSLGYNDAQIAAANKGISPFDGTKFDAEAHDNPNAPTVAPGGSGPPPPGTPPAPPSSGGPPGTPDAPMRSTSLDRYNQTPSEAATPGRTLSNDGIGDQITAADRSLAHEAQQLLNTPGTTRADFDALTRKYGVNPYPANLDSVLDYRNKGGKGARIAVGATKHIEQPAGTATQNNSTTASTIAAADSISFGVAPKVGAGLTAVTDKLTGADNRSIGDIYTDKLADTHDAMNILSQDHPYATLAGNAAGFIGGEGALKLAGKAIPGVLKLSSKIPGALKLPALDAVQGGLYGAGSQDHLDDVPGAALKGGGASMITGVLGRGAGKGLGRLISPSAGALGSLYEAGVRPTLGQRFAGSGRVGAGVNMIEEASQSLPVLGMLPRAARQDARDQFERGAFNSALGELDGVPGVATSLPKDMKLGTQPHAFMQEQFDKAYDHARSGMTFVSDQAYQADRAAFAKQLTNGVLSDDQVKRVGKILDHAVTSRLQASGGSLTGDAYKAAASDIGKAARQLSGSDPAISHALTDYGSIFDNAARRASHPEAVAALDKADAGYAKAVRIEMAASARGGDTGRFSPTQFDRAVQKASGGIRSRAYLRGDALMSDYAEAGKSLVDRLPNSGTADRLMTRELLTGQAMATAPVAALGYASPVGAALTGAVTLPYAPGVQRVTRGLLAPRNSKKAATLGDFIRKNSALGGRALSPLLLDRVANHGE